MEREEKLRIRDLGKEGAGKKDKTERERKGRRRKRRLIGDIEDRLEKERNE